ncbi:MAG: hypothetical protein JNK48_31860 [Bryobacterales bacterium]|nr:hypothetical protein [Bryobacterales bacterium]
MMPFLPPAPPVVSKMFSAIQAEGGLAGTPAVFLVSIDGPPRPVWCRQPRAESDVQAATLGGILSAVRRFWSDYAVITGGEPLRLDGMADFCAKLREFEHHVTVETSGAIFVENFPCDLMSVNIRLGAPASSKKKSAPFPAFDIAAVRQIVEHYPHQLKFYCEDSAAEWNEIKRIAAEVNVKRSNVFLLPTASKGKNLAAQLEWIEELSRVQGYRFAPRLSE